MAKLGEILRLRPRFDPVELDPDELDRMQAQIADRVARLSGSGTAESVDAAPSLEADVEAPEGKPAPESDHVADDTAQVTGERHGGPRPPIVVGGQRHRVPLMAEPDGLFVGVVASPGEPVLARRPAGPQALFVGPAADDLADVAVGRAGDGWDVPGFVDPVPPVTASVDAPHMSDGAAGDAPTAGREDAPTAGKATELARPIRSRAARPKPARATVVPPTPEEHAPDAPRARRPAVARATARSKRVPASIPPFCPSCAVLLEPPPKASRRCAQCRQRIIVKHVDGRTVYLAEAAVPVFEAERRRIAGAERLSRERGRWLRLADSAGAPAERTSRLAAAQPSEKAVDGARALYLATVERTFQGARRERRWADASRIRREQALILYRVLGSPVPPPAVIIKLHRDGVAAELHGIAEITRDAELVGATCCDACRADGGLVLRIAAELRILRLPHEGCPKGICRCRWDLGARDRTTVKRYLRSHGRTDRRPDPADPSTA